MYSEEEVVEIVEVLVPEEIVPEVIEVSPPLLKQHLKCGKCHPTRE